MFPPRSGRQRASNITVENPESEFQKTAINACRSTIAQQEVELKRQKEANDIRNKRILQLESVVGHATEFIATRDTTKDIPDDPLRAILTRIELIENRISNSLSSNPTNSIVINSCKSEHYPTLVERKTCSTQTDSLGNSEAATESASGDDIEDVGAAATGSQHSVTPEKL